MEMQNLPLFKYGEIVESICREATLMEMETISCLDRIEKYLLFQVLGSVIVSYNNYGLIINNFINS